MIHALIAVLLVSAPSRLDVLIEEAVQAKARGDLPRTLELLREAYAITPSYKITHNVAAVLEEMGRYAEAHAQYARVVADAETPPAVREADRARQVALEEKLDRAWIAVAGDTREVYLDGEPLPEVRGELRASPGPHVLEVRDGAIIHIARPHLPAGLRTTIAIAGASDELRRTCAVVTLAAAERFETLTIDGIALRGALSGSFTEVWLEPGDHELTVTAPSRASATVAAVAGETYALAELFPAVQAEVVPAPPRREGMSTPRLIALVAGGVAVAAAITGGVLLAGADSDRAAINDLPRDGGLVVGLSMREAVERDAAAGRAATAGAVTLAGAGAVGLGAVVLWLLD